MRNLDNNGFTLVEVLAVIVIISIILGIAVPNVMTSIEASKDSSEKILIENIKTAAQSLYEEVDNGIILKDTDNNEIKIQPCQDYFINSVGEECNIEQSNDTDCKKVKKCKIENIKLQTLVDNGFLKVSNVKDNDNDNDNEDNKLINSKTGEDIGECIITITKKVNIDDYSVSYKISGGDGTDGCPVYE